MKIMILFSFFLLQQTFYSKEIIQSVTVPMILDHNRMLIEGEIQRKDGSWRKVKFWIDSGSPNFILSQSLASDLGLDLSEVENSLNKVAGIDVSPPSNVRIGNFNLDFSDIKSRVTFQPFWLFSATGNDANLPATVLKKYHIVFDYPKKQITIAEQGSLKTQGVPVHANINSKTGITQIDVSLNGDNFSMALDVGASYSFISEDKLRKFSSSHPDWPNIVGTLGDANMWGWWPVHEETFSVIRIPQIQSGEVKFEEVGIVGVPAFSPQGPSLGEWYSQKTARPVDGFLGPNALKSFRVEIDYINNMVYFEKGAEIDFREMDLVGISVRQLEDKTYQIVGVIQKDGKSLAEGVEPGDILLKIDDMSTKGLTMGKVVDALRGNPGDIRLITIERNGKKSTIDAKVKHHL